MAHRPRPSRRSAVLTAALAVVATTGVVAAAPADAASPCRLRADQPFLIHDITGRTSVTAANTSLDCVATGRLQSSSGLQWYNGRAWVTTVGPVNGPVVWDHSAQGQVSVLYCASGLYRSAASGWANGQWQGVVFSPAVILVCTR